MAKRGSLEEETLRAGLQGDEGAKAWAERNRVCKELQTRGQTSGQRHGVGLAVAIKGASGALPGMGEVPKVPRGGLLLGDAMMRKGSPPPGDWECLASSPCLVPPRPLSLPPPLPLALGPGKGETAGLQPGCWFSTTESAQGRPARTLGSKCQ